MKFLTSFSYLLVCTNYCAFFASSASSQHDPYNFVIGNANKLNSEGDRWQRELEAFPRGLKINNDQGELVELTTEVVLLKTSMSIENGTNVFFHLYTKKNPTQYQRITIDSKSSIEDLRRSNYDSDKPTYFVTHGWKSSGGGSSCYLIRDAYLRNNEFNVIIVDWKVIADLSYRSAAELVPYVGGQVARMIEFLSITAGTKFHQIHLVGHSLGAHVMGIAGHLTNGTINTIYGLDPAQPMFLFAERGSRICPLDATHVQIIHTNAGFLGYLKPIGISDFYPNGGLFQLSCSIWDMGCSHSLAYELFAESINSRKGFWASQCSRFSFIFNKCKSSNDAKMGGLVVEPEPRGTYYLWTNENKPYAAGWQDW